MGDIILTFMAWLNDVNAGGGTGFSFPGSEILVNPTKGSVGFWFGLVSSGHLDDRQFHGGCPILSGSKWILNRWIYSFDQWKSYPCDLKPYVAIKPFTGITQ